MATTTGIQAYWSSAFKALPQKAIPLGSASQVYEPLAQSLNEAGNEFIQFFQVVVPVGFGWASVTNFDYINLCTLGGNYSNLAANTVVPGLRIKKLVIRSSGNAGNTQLTYVGYASGNNLIGTGSALQGGAVVGVPAVGVTGSIMSSAAVTAVVDPQPAGTGAAISLAVTPILLTADTLIIAPIAVVNLTTTLVTLDGFVEYFITGPTGF